MRNRLLIIEDSPSIAKLQKHIGIKAGYDVDIAHSLKQAIALFEKHSYFCAVVDFVIPDAPNGESIAFTVGAGIATIVMTGKIDKKTRDIVLKHPVVDYITKENKQSYKYLETQLCRLPKNTGVHILVVDDSLATRNYIKGLLTRQKYQVSYAINGAQALKTLAEHPEITVIITDNQMPVMTGVQLTLEIRQKYSQDEIIIIGISSTKNKQISAKFLKNGANDYLTKPFNSEEFYCRLSQNIEMLNNIATIKKQANTDYLTELFNRRYFFEACKLKLKKHKSKVTLAMLDIDHFKSINDNYGHDIGDEILKGFANLFKQHFSTQLIARLGGEEFAIYFQNTNLIDAKKMLEEFRVAISDTPIQGISFTISIGLACRESNNIDKVLKIADEHLYTAKGFGRNLVISDPE